MSLEGPESGSLRIAADVGGTFTDIAVFDEWPRPPKAAWEPRRFRPLRAGFLFGRLSWRPLSFQNKRAMSDYGK
jgi:hypothetical protein